jgi:hypothetical protein
MPGDLDADQTNHYISRHGKIMYFYALVVANISSRWYYELLTYLGRRHLERRRNLKGRWRKDPFLVIRLMLVCSIQIVVSH